MKKLFCIISLFCSELYASSFALDEYYGINDSISNSYAYQLSYAPSAEVQIGVVAVTSQLYSSDEGYYLIPQNFALRAIKNFEGENWDLQFGILRWSHIDPAFFHKTSYEVSFGIYINDIEFRLSQYTDQYQESKNFNLTLLYFYLEF